MKDLNDDLAALLAPRTKGFYLLERTALLSHYSEKLLSKYLNKLMNVFDDTHTLTSKKVMKKVRGEYIKQSMIFLNELVYRLIKNIEGGVPICHDILNDKTKYKYIRYNTNTTHCPNIAHTLVDLGILYFTKPIIGIRLTSYHLRNETVRQFWNAQGKGILGVSFLGTSLKGLAYRSEAWLNMRLDLKITPKNYNTSEVIDHSPPKSKKFDLSNINIHSTAQLVRQTIDEDVSNDHYQLITRPKQIANGLPKCRDYSIKIKHIGQKQEIIDNYHAVRSSLVPLKFNLMGILHFMHDARKVIAECKALYKEATENRNFMRYEIKDINEQLTKAVQSYSYAIESYRQWLNNNVYKVDPEDPRCGLMYLKYDVAVKGGRSYEKKGGFQTLPKILKHYLLCSNLGMDEPFEYYVSNYDLVSSQLSLLRKLSIMMGMNPNLLDGSGNEINLLDTFSNIDCLSNKLDERLDGSNIVVTRDEVKLLVYGSLFNLGQVNTSSESNVYKALIANHTEDHVDKILWGWNMISGPLSNHLTRLATALIHRQSKPARGQVLKATHQEFTASNGLRSHVAKVSVITKEGSDRIGELIPNSQGLLRKVLAYELQGLESVAINELITKNQGYVSAIEHDGILMKKSNRATLEFDKYSILEDKEYLSVIPWAIEMEKTVSIYRLRPRVRRIIKRKAK